jgi:DnaK suppressor protein
MSTPATGVRGSPAARSADPDVDLAGLREALERERRFRIEQLAELAAAPARRDDPRAEVDALVVAGARRALADIDAALEAMRRGRYGRCGACAGPIPWRVLCANPRARLCWTCQASEDGAGTAHPLARSTPDRARGPWRA